MRVAVTFPGCHRRAGVERVAFESARFLATRGHDVLVHATQWETDTTAPVRYRSIEARRRPAFLQPREFFRAFSEQVGHDFDVLASFGCVCPTGGVYWAQSVHAAWLQRSASNRGRFSIKRWKQRINPVHPALLKLEEYHLGGRRYQKVIALTQDVKQDLIRCYHVPEQDIVILPNGFSDAEFNFETRQRFRSEIRTELGYTNDDRVIIFAANELERKGFGPLLRAVASLNDANTHLLAVGRLSSAAYAAEISKLRMTDRVQFTGPSATIAKYYAAADVFALPTQYEAWGLVIVEALACGLPVLTSRLAGASVCVEEGVTGELLDHPGDIEQIAEKLKLLLHGYRTPDEAVSRSVSAYSWDNILPRYEQILFESVGVALANQSSE